MKAINRFVIFLILPFLTSSCKDNNDKDPGESFDRKPLLENLANNVIIPHLKLLQVKTDSMVLAVGQLKSNPDQATLNAAKQSWISAYTQYQYCNAFNFGPGEKSIIGTFNENLATWLVNVTVIESRVVNSDYNFNDFRRDSRGFLTLDYLLFEDSALVKLNDVNGTKRAEFASQVSTNIKSWVDEINTGWQTYKDQFTANTDKSAGSPTSLFYNEYVKSFEALKNFKIALPAGKRAGQTQAEPQLSEALYSELSIHFFKSHFKAIHDMWYGIGLNGTNGTGFDDYLDKLEGGPALKSLTIAQLNLVNDANKTFSDNEVYSTLVISDPTRVDQLHTEYQKLTRYLKSDLSSLMGIAITYSSGDGD